MGVKYGVEKISVIIPMYNAEPYIRRCLQSVRDQTYQNWEAIVIDDGSTDGGADICRELAAADRRIHLVTQENGGVSAARNRGLDIAMGAFLFFLDADDAVHPLLLEEMIAQAHRTGADLLACDHSYVEPGRMESVLSTASVHDKRPIWEVPHQNEVINLVFGRFARFMSGTGGKMIRHSAIQEEEPLRFREDLFMGEDTYFLYQLYHRPIRVACTNQRWYYYVQNPASLSHSLASTADPRYYGLYYLLQEYDLGVGEADGGLKWEMSLCERLKKNFLLQRKGKNAAGMAAIRKIAAAECKRPLFRGMPKHVQRPFRWLFFNYPFYKIHRAVRYVSISMRFYLKEYGGILRRTDL